MFPTNSQNVNHSINTLDTENTETTLILKQTFQKNQILKNFRNNSNQIYNSEIVDYERDAFNLRNVKSKNSEPSPKVSGPQADDFKVKKIINEININLQEPNLTPNMSESSRQDSRKISSNMSQNQPESFDTPGNSHIHTDNKKFHIQQGSNITFKNQTAEKDTFSFKSESRTRNKVMLIIGETDEDIEFEDQLLRGSLKKNQEIENAGGYDTGKEGAMSRHSVERKAVGANIKGEQSEILKRARTSDQYRTQKEIGRILQNDLHKPKAAVSQIYQHESRDSGELKSENIDSQLKTNEITYPELMGPNQTKKQADIKALVSRFGDSDRPSVYTSYSVQRDGSSARDNPKEPGNETRRIKNFRVETEQQNNWRPVPGQEGEIREEEDGIHSENEEELSYSVSINDISETEITRKGTARSDFMSDGSKHENGGRERTGSRQMRQEHSSDDQIEEGTVSINSADESDDQVQGKHRRCGKIFLTSHLHSNSNGTYM